jgi:hypothetical protein
MMAKCSRLTRCILVVSSTICRAATISPSPLPDVSEIIAGISHNDQLKQANLQDWSVIRHYTLKNSRTSAPAELTVRVSFERGVGKRFEILSATNASGMCRKVLDRILAAEMDASRPDAEEHRLDAQNYEFELLGTEGIGGRLYYVLSLQPRRKNRFLLQGKAWVGAENFGLLKIEGHPAANLSFWVGKPEITQEFQKYGDFWMSSHNRSLLDSCILGKSELTIDYSQYELNTRPAQSLAMRSARPQSALE